MQKNICDILRNLRVNKDLVRIHQNPCQINEYLMISRNHSNFERSQLRDAGEFDNFETCYHYLLPEIHPFPGELTGENRGTRLEIDRPVVFETGFGHSGQTADVHLPTDGVVWAAMESAVAICIMQLLIPGWL